MSETSTLRLAEGLIFEAWFLVAPACLLGLLVAPWLGIVLGCAVLPLLDWKANRRRQT